MLNFDWDTEKAKINFQKHGVSFEEAMTVFEDPEALLIADPEHSTEEDRFILLGLSSSFRLIIVCHCYRKEETIRLFSARKATKSERNQYNRHIGLDNYA